MKCAVSSYSFNQRIKKGEITQKDTVRLAAEMGYEGIDFTSLMPNNDKNATLEAQLAFAKEIRAEAEACGMTIIGYTVPACLYNEDAAADQAEVERLCGQVDVAAALGASIMRHDVSKTAMVNDKVVSFDRRVPTIAENARKIADYAKTKGIRTCTENHGFFSQDSERMERLYNAVAHDNFGLLVDVGNFACVDEPSIPAVSRLAPYAVHVHVKDMHILPFGAELDPEIKYMETRGCNNLRFCTIGNGDIPVEQCLAILRRAGYNGWISLEYEGVEDCMAEIPVCLERLKGYLAKAEAKETK